MPIRSGIGIGEAQIYDTSGLANQFAKQVYNRNLQLQKQYEQQQKEQAKVADEMSSLLAKYSTKGLKEADIKLVGDKYKEVKDIAGKASTTKDPIERTKYINEARAGIQSISEYVDNANNNYGVLDKLAVDMSENGWRYEPEAIQEVKKLYDLPVAQWGKYASLNPTMFQRKPDASSLYAIVDDVNKDLESAVKYNPKFLKTRTEGGRIYDSYVATPEQAKNALLARIQVNPKAKFTLDAMYREANPTKTDYTDLDLAQFATDNLYSKKPDAYNFVSAPRDIPKAPKEKDVDTDKLTYRQQLITGLINQNEDYRQELQANLPPNSIVKYGVSKKVPGVSLGGYKFMDITIPGESTVDGIEVKERIPLQAGKPVQKLNYIINQYSPEKVSPSKVGIKGGKTAGEKFEVSQQPTAKKEIKQSEIDAKAKAAGYSVAEYTKLLQKNGIKIIK